MTERTDGIPVTITWLEMHAKPNLHVPMPPPKIAGGTLAVLRAENPPLHWYRYLYRRVGQPHHWNDRLRMEDDALKAIINDPKVEIWVLFVAGVPAGYAELDFRSEGEADLAYFGLLPEFAGRALGKALLWRAIELAWAKPIKRLTVQTNTLDHPRALPLYQKLGFVPFAQEQAEIFPLSGEEKIAFIGQV